MIFEGQLFIFYGVSNKSRNGFIEKTKKSIKKLIEIIWR